jgi:copper chaperone CopZ
MVLEIILSSIAVVVIVGVCTEIKLLCKNYINSMDKNNEVRRNIMYKFTLKVDGMCCGMCESHVNDVVRKTANVKSVKSSHAKGQTEIVCENDIDVDGIKRAIEAQGYHVETVSKEPYEKKGVFSFLKK